jgi:hypothetical protein
LILKQRIREQSTPGPPWLPRDRKAPPPQSHPGAGSAH